MCAARALTAWPPRGKRGHVFAWPRAVARDYPGDDITHRKTRVETILGGPQRPKIHQCGISRNRLTLKSSPIPAVSAVVAADWRRLDGSMET